MRWRKWLIGTWNWKRPLKSLAFIYGCLLIVAVFFAEKLFFLPPPPGYEESSQILKLKTTSGDSIAAASNLIATLSTIEAPGRVVERQEQPLGFEPWLSQPLGEDTAGPAASASARRHAHRLHHRVRRARPRRRDG